MHCHSALVLESRLPKGGKGDANARGTGGRSGEARPAGNNAAAGIIAGEDRPLIVVDM